MRSTYSVVLDNARQEYDGLRERFLRGPDGRWVADGSTAGRSAESLPKRHSASPQGNPANVQVNNPLGLDSDNPWSSWFEDLESRKVIRQDVERT